MFPQTQKGRGVASDTAGTLDAPSRHQPEGQRPHLERAMTLAGTLEVLRPEQPAAIVQDGGRESALVGIDADGVALWISTLFAASWCFHPLLPSPTVKEAPVDISRLRKPSSYQVRPAP